MRSCIPINAIDEYCSPPVDQQAVCKRMLKPFGFDVQSGKPYDQFLLENSWDKLPSAQLWRHTVNATNGRTTRRLMMERSVEFPAINPEYSGTCFHCQKSKASRIYLHCQAPSCSKVQFGSHMTMPIGRASGCQDVCCVSIVSVHFATSLHQHHGDYAQLAVLGHMLPIFCP